MNWLYYLLEANLYLAAFYLLYKLLLQNSTFYNSNRYFLVLSIMVAFTIPLIQLGFLKPQILLPIEDVVYDFPTETIELAKVAPTPTLTKEDYIIYGYLILASILSLKFFLSIAKIIKIYTNSKKRELNGYTLVEVATEHTAFSFFNILFIHPDMVKNNTVLRHEIIHIKQKHSWDIILLELLKIFCWFNPIVYLIKRDLTLLHEYIADERTTSNAISKHEYAMFLIENSMASYSPSLVNQFFNQSILKSRINMLNKEKTANWARLKYLLAVPLGVGLLCVSTLGFSKSYGYELFSAQQEKAEEIVSTQEKKKFYPKYRHDKDGNYISLEERTIVINGNIIKDKNKYYGTAEADKIVFLNSADAIKKYGADKGKNGAVELYGEKVVHTFPPPVVRRDQVKFPPPRIEKNKAKVGVKPNQVKFPPPSVEPQPARYSPENQKTFYPRNAYNNKKLTEVDKRLIVINGEFVEDNSKFYGIINADKIEILNPKEATRIYGKKGIYGAVQISGNVKGTGLVEPPPSLYKSPIEIDRNKGDLLSFSKVSEVKALTIYDRRGKVIYNNPNYNDDWDTKKGNYEDYDGKELASGTYYYFVKVNEAPEKSMRGSFFAKGQGSKTTTNDNLNKTGAVKKVNGYDAKGKKEVTTAKSAFEKTNNVFNKAWTLYKPKPEVNKNDNC